MVQEVAFPLHHTFHPGKSLREEACSVCAMDSPNRPAIVSQLSKAELGANEHFNTRIRGGTCGLNKEVGYKQEKLVV